MNVHFSWSFEELKDGPAWVGKLKKPKGLEARAVVSNWRFDRAWDQRVYIDGHVIISGCGSYCDTAQGGKRRAAFMIRRYLEGAHHDTAMTTTGIRMSKSLLARLRKQANSEGVATSVICRRAILAELERVEAER